MKIIDLCLALNETQVRAGAGDILAVGNRIADLDVTFTMRLLPSARSMCLKVHLPGDGISEPKERENLRNLDVPYVGPGGHWTLLSESSILQSGANIEIDGAIPSM